MYERTDTFRLTESNDVNCFISTIHSEWHSVCAIEAKVQRRKN